MFLSGLFKTSGLFRTSGLFKTSGLLNASLLVLLAVAPFLALAQTDDSVRWLDPADDAKNLPTDGSILFWSGDQQIAGFRNTAVLSLSLIHI